MSTLTKEQFLQKTWAKIHTTGCPAIDAVVDVAEANNVDMEAAAKLINRDVALKALLEQQARQLHQLKKVNAAAV